MQATSQPGTSLQAASQYVDPHADPHDAIVELLHNHAKRTANDPSKLDITPAGKPAESDTSAPSTAPSVMDDVHAALNDNAIRPSEFRTQATPKRRGGMISRALLTLCAGVAVTVAWHTYADEAKERLSQFVPQLFASTPATAQDASQNANPTDPQQQDATAQAVAPQPAAAEAAPAQAAAAATPARAPQTPASQETTTAAAAPAAQPAPAQATLPPEVTQTIEAMSREIASLKQTVEQLKASQQHSRDLAKAGEHETRRKPATSTQAAKPAAQQQRTSTTMSPPSATPPYVAAVQRAQASAPYVPPPPAYRPSPTSSGAVQREAYIPPPPPAPAPVPRRLPPEPGYETAPRPPMPLQY